jgi:uncharacterized protein (DUF1800 family)
MQKRMSLVKAWQQTLGSDPAFATSANDVLPKRATVAAGLEPFTGAWNATQARHLLRRTLFGFTSQHLKEVTGRTLTQTVEALLASTTAPLPPVAVSDKDTGVTLGETWVTATYDGTLNFVRGQSLQAWWMGTMVNQEISLVEKMTLFWHHHFATELGSAGDARYMYNQNVLFRSQAFGNFKTLAKAVNLDCAMLRYLNGNSNTAKNPNENYGRELQELFTIGKGPEIGVGNYTFYTEEDVKAAARVLTGFSDVRVTMTSQFTAKNHDAADKIFSAAYGNAVILGRAGEDGAKEADELIDLIFAQDETALLLCRKLYRFFVYYVIDETTEKTIILPMATMLRSGGYEIKPVLSALFNSAHFHHALNQGCMIKTPIDLIVGFTSQFPTTFPDATDSVATYTLWKSLHGQAAGMQLELLEPPNVAGWPAYWQEPVYYELWINSDTLPKRVRFADQFISNLKWTASTSAIKLDVIAMAEAMSKPNDVKQLIADLADLFFPIPLTDKQLVYLKDTLLNKLPDYEWGVDWDAYALNKTDAAARKAVESRLKTLFRAITAMAEYQLC